MNALFDVARRRMLSNQLDWAQLPVRMLAFASEYEFDPAHVTVGELGVGAVAESEVFTNQEVTDGGYAASDQAWFQTPALSPPWLFLVMVDDSTVGTARELIAYYDTGYNLPRTINGQDQIVIPDWLNERGWFRP